MSTRVLPEPDHFATCPQDGGILDYYAGVFDAVFVALHPFIKPVSIPGSLFEPDTYPDRKSIAEHCAPVPWAEVTRLAGLPSLAAVDLGLRSSIHGLRAEFARDDYAEALEGLFPEHGILCPTEGQFSELVHDRILDAFQHLGHQWAWVGDEFGTERKLHWIDALRVASGSALTEGHRNVFTPDRSLLYTTHWDRHFSLLCGSRGELDAIVARAGLEGFFCVPDTRMSWSVALQG